MHMDLHLFQMKENQFHVHEVHFQDKIEFQFDQHDLQFNSFLYFTN